jgi:uncharacterized Tic20 family protein
MNNQSDRNTATLLHLMGFLGLVFPLGNVVGPVILWLVKKDESPLIDKEGKKAINFQITMSIAMIISTLLIFIVVGLIFIVAIMILEFVAIITAAIRTSQGQEYNYPFSFEFLK